MSQSTIQTPLSEALPERTNWQATSAAFWGLSLRDIKVTFGNVPSFLAQVLIQPIFLLFVFGKILPELNYASGNYGGQLLPGIISLTVLLTALQTTSLPLVIDFSFTKEIEDRLLAPLPVAMVAVEKIFIATLRGLVGGLVLFPLGWLILGDKLTITVENPLLLAVVMILAGLVGSAAGLTLGTIVQASQINVVFAIVLTPLIFTGCTYYPWEGLSRIQWFQIVTLFNPLTYASEGLRASLTNGPHMPIWAILLGLFVSLLIFGYFGIRGFMRRAVD